MKTRILTPKDLSTSTNPYIADWRNLKNFSVAPSSSANFLEDYKMQRICVNGRKIPPSQQDKPNDVIIGCLNEALIYRFQKINGFSNEPFYLSKAYSQEPFGVIHTALHEVMTNTKLQVFAARDVHYNVKSENLDIYLEATQENFPLRNLQGELLGYISIPVKIVFKLELDNQFHLAHIATANPLVLDILMGEKVPGKEDGIGYYQKQYPNLIKSTQAYELEQQLKAVKERLATMPKQIDRLQNAYQDFYFALEKLSQQTLHLLQEKSAPRQAKGLQMQQALMTICNDMLEFIPQPGIKIKKGKNKPKSQNAKANAFAKKVQTQLNNAIFDKHRSTVRMVLKAVKDILACFILYGFVKAYRVGGFFKTATREKANVLMNQCVSLARKLGVK